MEINSSESLLCNSETPEALKMKRFYIFPETHLALKISLSHEILNLSNTIYLRKEQSYQWLNTCFKMYKYINSILSDRLRYIHSSYEHSTCCVRLKKKLSHQVKKEPNYSPIS